MQSKTGSYLANLLQFCIDNKIHKSGKLLHAYILRTNQFSNTFLVNRLIELYSKCGHTTSARHLFDQMPVRNIYSYHAVLDACCKSNDLDNAYQLFAEMPERNSVTWNLIITALSHNGYEKKALENFYLMRLGSFEPTRFTLASVLSACGGASDVECGRECHGVAIKLGLDGNFFVGNALLGMYAKCGFVWDAVEVFKDLPEHNEVAFTAMMKGLVETDRVHEAFDMFKLMHRVGISIDSVSLSSVLGVCAKSGFEDFVVDNANDGNWHNVHGKQIHGLVIKLGFERDLQLNNSLLDMYAKQGDMECAEIIFDNMSEVSVVSWNVMIGGFGQKYNKERAMEYMEKMKNQGFEPNEVTYVNILAACVKSGDVETGRQMFDNMSCPSLSSWNALLSGYSQNEYHREAVMLFREMQFRNVQPDRTTFAIVLSSCAGMGLLDGGKPVHAALLKGEVYTDLYVASGLIGLYSKCSKIEMAKHVFDELPQYDVVCWNSMIAGLSLNSLDAEAFIFFKQMLGKGMLPTEFSFATVLSCCSALTSLSLGRQIHDLIVKDGFAIDMYVGSALIDMYCKCGDVDVARQFFDTMSCKSTVTWNEIIHGYAQNGRGDEAVTLFENMILTGTKPDDITFVAVLAACSHSGLVDSGLKIFNSMQQEHGLEPLVDHYTCIIDSLGRAGRINEVEALIDKIPCKDDPVVWEVLLSSCRICADVNLARRAANELFRLDPKNSAPYALLASIYSSLGRWDDVKDVRRMMDERQVSKDPGYSWVEHKTRMHTSLGSYTN
ncbi:Pentatricopeptide repeat-containing protein [Abeliophyllum distichum]|uniref:Pentatricopeptide repeat-containing protein n=1 Tax=Abeliophyllum distichum TaxID=126358 RepID=A0ABD1QEZ2_9LAMI